MADSERIKGFMRQKGPIIPVALAKELNTSILFASAMLSELVSNKEIRISSVKIGGSPFYFLPSQEADLQKLSQYLPEKERIAYNLLKERQILDDKAQDPVIRVALRQIKDYARELQVVVKGERKIFWKWYLLPNSEAETIIKKMLRIPVKSEPKKAVKEEPVRRQAPELEKPVQKKENPRETRQQVKKEEAQETLPSEKPEPIRGDAFYSEINSFFMKNSIEIVSQKVVRKNSEIEFTLRMPSAVGKIMYFCKAKSKKKINDGDLSSAFVQGQAQKLPVLFITKGDLTKKAKEMLGSEFKNITVKNI